MAERCFSKIPRRMERGGRSAGGYTSAQKKTMTLSKETLDGIKISGNLAEGAFLESNQLLSAVLSFVEVSSYLLRTVPNVKYLLREKFCQDRLEAYFGKQRYKCGANTNPSLSEFQSNAFKFRHLLHLIQSERTAKEVGGRR